MATHRTYEAELNPEKALIFRIVHLSNVPWILDNGLYCGNNVVHRNPEWVSIGNADLTARRAQHLIPEPNAGFLNDYVPFYFTPFSPMLLNIKSGRNGVPQRPNSEIVILVSSLRRIAQMQLRYWFTDAHAYVAYANFFNDLEDLHHIDWGILQRRDFARDLNDLNKMERYQAEALVHTHVPVTALLGIVCYTEEVRRQVQLAVEQRQLQLKVLSKTGWYF